MENECCNNILTPPIIPNCPNCLAGYNIPTLTNGTLTWNGTAWVFTPFAGSAVLSVQDVVPVNDAIITSNGAQRLNITPAGSLSAFIIGFPSNPVNGQIFGINTTQAVTTVALSATPATIQNTLTSLTANQSAVWYYDSSTTTWRSW